MLEMEIVGPDFADPSQESRCGAGGDVEDLNCVEEDCCREYEIL
jgi:hypothetical protein